MFYQHVVVVVVVDCTFHFLPSRLSQVEWDNLVVGTRASCFARNPTRGVATHWWPTRPACLAALLGGNWPFVISVIVLFGKVKIPTEIEVAPAHKLLTLLHRLLCLHCSYHLHCLQCFHWFCCFQCVHSGIYVLMWYGYMALWASEQKLECME